MPEHVAGNGPPEVSLGASPSAVRSAGNDQALYWSHRGEVACALHVPGLNSQRWVDERWAEVPGDMRSHQRARYQCQHCAASKTPIAHRRLNTFIHL